MHKLVTIVTTVQLQLYERSLGSAYNQFLLCLHCNVWKWEKKGRRWRGKNDLFNYQWEI